MRRIVDDNFAVKFPPYLSPAGKDFVLRLLERKPTKRLGMLQVRAGRGLGGWVGERGRCAKAGATQAAVCTVALEVQQLCVGRELRPCLPSPCRARRGM